MISFRPIANFIVASYGTLAFCSAIVFAAIFCFVRFWGKLRSIREHLEAALTRLKSMPPSDAFASEFKEFNEFISGNPVLRKTWAEFRKALILPSATEKASSIFKTEEAERYFNEGSVIAGSVNLRFYGAFPNYLTGAGILGTFVGLVAGIYLASQGLASNDEKVITGSLQSLLNGASLAFWTSICGLFCSILFSWREKVLIHDLMRFIDDWNAELDKRIGKVKPEVLARKQLSQLQKQTEYLEEFVTKVAFNIAEALDNRLNQRLLPALDNRLNEKLVPVLEKVINSVESMRQERGDGSERFIQQMVDKFSETMTGAAGNEINAMTSTLNNLNAVLVPLLQEMNDASSQMQNSARYIAEQIKASYENGGKVFSDQMQMAMSQLNSGVSEAGNVLNKELREAFGQTVGRLDVVVTKLDSSIGSLGATGTNTEQMAIRTKALLEQFTSMAKDVNVIQTKMQSSLQSLEKTAASIENAGNAARQNLAQSVKVLEDFKVAAAEFRNVQQELKHVWNSYAVRFEDVDSSLEKIFNQISDGLGAYAEGTTKYMRELDIHAQKVTEQFSGAIREFGEAIDSLSDAFGQASK